MISLVTAFISGHRDVSEDEFEQHYIPEIDKAIEQNHAFVIGDYGGVDIMAQRYLNSKNYHAVVVYHMFADARRHISGLATRGGYRSDEERDAAMTSASSYDIAWVRPGKEKSGTSINLKRRAASTRSNDGSEEANSI